MNKVPDDSDTQLVHLLKAGNKDAANELISRYFERVVGLAEKHLRGQRLRVTEGDDIAASVFESLWEQANSERLAGKELADSQQLWRLLCKMVAFKSRSHMRKERTLKRGGGVLKGESVLGEQGGLEGIEKLAFTPDELIAAREQYDNLMEKLDDDQLRQIAVMRLSGYQVAEIADVFGGKSRRWVGRKLSLIREIWSVEFESLCT